MGSELRSRDLTFRPAILQWSWQGRLLVFLLSASSIWCLLAEMYNLCSMRTFTFTILIPATLALVVIALFDRARGDGQLWRAVLIGAAGGFLPPARMIFSAWPGWWAMPIKSVRAGSALPLFKVFPHFAH